NLANNLIYNVAIDPRNPFTMYATSQDQLRTLKYTGQSQWEYISSGNEIGRTVIDPTNPNLLYNLASVQGGFMRRSTDGGASWAAAADGLNPNDFPQSDEFEELVYDALAIDITDPTRLVLGSTKVYQTTDSAQLWTPIRPPLAPIAGGDASTLITAIALAASDADVIYAATQDGHFFATFNDGTTWLERDQGLPDADDHEVVQIRVDPANAQRLFVVTTGPASTGRVWMTINGGQSWTDLTGDLPSLQASSIEVDWRFATPVLYVGTMRAAYYSTNLGVAWAVAGEGLPNTEVRDLELAPQFDFLVAGTYGRGVFQTSTAEPALLGPTVPLRT